MKFKSHFFKLPLSEVLLTITFLLLPILNHYEDITVFSISGRKVDIRVLSYIIVTSLFGLLFIIYKFKVPNKVFVYFLIAYIIYILISTLLVSPKLILGLPTSIRFIGYFLVFITSYNLVIKAENDMKINMLIRYIIYSSIIPILVALYQYFFNTAIFLNGAYRLTGTYTVHPLAFSMFLQTVGLILYMFFLRKIKFNGYLLLFILLGFVLLNTHSRLVIVTFILGIIVIDLLTNKKKRIIPMILLALSVIIIEKSILTRFLNTLNLDNSTSFRFYIHEIMLPKILESPFYGYGTGTFPFIFEKLTKIPNVASHDEYLGIAIDGGIIGLIIYLLMQLSLMYYFLKRINKKKGSLKNIFILAGLLYFITNILNVIENPNYFFDVQIIIWSLIGLSIGYEINENNLTFKKKEKFYLIGQNQQQIKNLLLVADKLIEKGYKKTDFQFISLDNVHFQDTNTNIKKEGYRYIDLSFKLDKPFYLNKYTKRISSVLKAKIFFNKVLNKEDDILLLGCDGAFERAAINTLNNCKRTFLIVDGILSDTSFTLWDVILKSNEKTKDIFILLKQKLKYLISIVFRLFSLDYLAFSNVGHSNSGTIFVIGQSTKDLLVKQGVNSSKIIVTGLPRFENYKYLYEHNNIFSERKKNRKIKVLYLSSAFKWHSLKKFDKFQKMDLIQLVKFFSGNSNYEFNIKIHPRESMNDYEWVINKYENIKILDGDLKEKIIEHDFVISAFSTGLLEAIELNRLPISYTSSFDKYEISKLFVFYKDFININDINSLKNFLDLNSKSESKYNDNLKKVRKVFNYLYYSDDRTSSDIISDIIIQKIMEMN